MANPSKLLTIDRKELKALIVPYFKAELRCLPLDEEINFIADKVEQALHEKVTSEVSNSKLKKIHSDFLKSPAPAPGKADAAK